MLGDHKEVELATPDPRVLDLRRYDAARTLSSKEREALPVLALGAAMRFFLTRLADWETTPADALVTPKDPMEYVRKLDHWRGAVARGERL